jgi:CarD family transcriptional regulator
MALGVVGSRFPWFVQENLDETQLFSIELFTRVGEPMIDYRIGDKVVYPNHGVGIIEQVSFNYLNGSSERCFMLRIFSSGLRVMVPETNAGSVGLRRVITSAEAKRILVFLEDHQHTNNSHGDWKHRFKENSERMRTGSLQDVAAVLKNLLALSRTKPLSFREKKMLERAKYLLVSELATAQRSSEMKVETDVVRALGKAKLQFPEIGIAAAAE